MRGEVLRLDAPRDATRAGVTRSVVAAYERSAREPSLATIAALVEATGVALDLALGDDLPATHSRRGPVGHRLHRCRAAVLAVATRHGVSDLHVFGSVARGEDGPNSDLDLLVHLPPDAGLFMLWRCRQELQDLLGFPSTSSRTTASSLESGATSSRTSWPCDAATTTRSARQRLLDVLEAVEAIQRHLERGPLTDGLVFDAVRVRLIEIGEAVKDVPAELLAGQPHIPWRGVAAMREELAHRYFDTSFAIVEHTVRIDLAELAAATQVLIDALPPPAE